MALKCKQSARQITLISRRKSTAPRLRPSRLTLVFVGEGLAPPSCFSLLLLVAAYSSRLPTPKSNPPFQSKTPQNKSPTPNDPTKPQNTATSALLPPDNSTKPA